MTQETLTLSAPSVGLLLHALGQLGHDTQAICQKVNLRPNLVHDVHARIPVGQVQELWHAAVAATQNPDLALEVAQQINPTTMGTIAYVMMNAPTLQEALRKLCKYQDLVCGAIQTSLQVEQQLALVRLDPVWEALPAPRNALDSELVIYKSAFSALIGQPIPYKEVLFCYPEPASTKAHQHCFPGAKLVFGAPYGGLLFSQECLQLPVVTANPELSSMFEQYADAYLQKLKEPNTVRERVQRELAQLLQGDEPTIQKVARSMAMSVRSLQSKLRDEGVNYQMLLDEVRKELALKHLASGQTTIADIAYLLGFSETSVFSRSFKKWTGMAPAAYRQQLT